MAVAVVAVAPAVEGVHRVARHRGSFRGKNARADLLEFAYSLEATLGDNQNRPMRHTSKNCPGMLRRPHSEWAVVPKATVVKMVETLG